MFPGEASLVIGGIAALVLTILLYIKVLPRKFDGTFDKPIFQQLHDFLNFKKLYLEEVLKFFYVLATVSVICVGALFILSYQETWSYYGTRKESLAGYGIALLVGGPIALRLTYEVFMMFILLVKNVMEINNKMSNSNEAQAVAQALDAAPAGPIAPNASASAPALVCPVCGAAHGQGDAFCTTCGQKLN